MCFLRVVVWLIQFSGRCAFPPRSRAASPKVWSLGVWDGLNKSGWSCPWIVMQAPATSHSVGPGRWHFWLGRSRWHNGAPRERGGCQKWSELVEDSWSILVIFSLQRFQKALAGKFGVALPGPHLFCFTTTSTSCAGSLGLEGCHPQKHAEVCLETVFWCILMMFR